MSVYSIVPYLNNKKFLDKYDIYCTAVFINGIPQLLDQIILDSHHESNYNHALSKQQEENPSIEPSAI